MGPSPPSKRLTKLAPPLSISEKRRWGSTPMGVLKSQFFEILFWPKTRLLGSVGAGNGSAWPKKSRGVRIRAQNWPKIQNIVPKKHQTIQQVWNSKTPIGVDPIG